MPGLLRGVARTAIVSGTATAVSNRVSRRQRGRWAEQERAQYAAAPPPSYTQQPPAPAPAPAPTPDMTDKIEQLKQLGDLKAQGVLSEAEFEEQKRRVLEA
ncbi:SHOCT domain-containing protein [Streptomyces cinnabarinus]|uniref:SHOCT domain-containing protein n=1 Tax=Streptomyces cinnabarinus TaxID=67287 RepID=A0ABY7KS79_9ACTN|nr:SHOCT domain-containing protein [Streptomyces cinnabarinus]WAZ25957.1 SHOCT domain-containing protein [Streptomyces cinnabarinus]